MKHKLRNITWIKIYDSEKSDSGNHTAYADTAVGRFFIRNDLENGRVYRLTHNENLIDVAMSMDELIAAVEEYILNIVKELIEDGPVMRG